jgi:quinol monooxygenase YgiN
VIVVSRFALDAATADGFAERAQAALAAFAARPGFRRGHVGRATDDPDAWVVVTEWDGIGSYRRSLSSYDVKVDAAPLLGVAAAEQSAFEVLVMVEGAGPTTTAVSGRARDAGQVRVGEAAAPAVPTDDAGDAR